MTKRGLTGNERHVLYGLVRHPTLNDRELSEILGVKVSTVTAIRRRLRKAEFFVTKRVPMMHRLGWEVLAAGYAHFDAAQSAQAVGRIREFLKDRVPDLFHVSVSTDHLVFLAAEPSYTALRRDVDELRVGLERGKLLGLSDVGVSVFPMSLSIVPAFFDFSHVLALAFGLDNRVTAKLEHGKIGDLSLTRKEAEVLKGLVRLPELSDKALAQKVKVSRQAVSKMRREFEREGLVRTVRIPNIRLLGFDLFVSGFSRFRPLANLRARAEALEKTLRMPAYFILSSDEESLVMGAAKNYEQFSALRGSIVRYQEEHGFLEGEPLVFLGLTGSTELIRNCEFGPLVQGLGEKGVRAGH